MGAHGKRKIRNHGDEACLDLDRRGSPGAGGRDPDTREQGRSAFVSAAIERYLAAKRRRDIDAQLAKAYKGHADAALAAVVDFIERQAWPDD